MCAPWAESAIANFDALDYYAIDFTKISGR